MASKKQVEVENKKENDKFGKNLAGNKDLARKFFDQVQGKMQWARNNRLATEQRWLEDLRAWSCVNDSNGYVGRSNVYIPELHGQIESTVEKTLTSLFPGNDYIRCVAMKSPDEDKVEKVRAAIQYELEQNNKLSVTYAEFERQKVLLGTSVYKGSFTKQMIDIFVRNEKTGKVEKKRVPKRFGTDWRTVDMFRWYVYPEIATELEDAEITFEDAFVDMNIVKNSGLYVNLDDIRPINKQYQNNWVDSERLAMVDLTIAATQYSKAVLLTEAWTEMEINGVLVPVCGVIANYNNVVRLIRNPFWFQENPYLMSRYLKRPGSIIYGFSLPDRIRSMAYLMTDTTNQTVDSMNYALNPIMAIDPALAGDVNSFKVQPGAKWLGSPEGIKPIAFTDVTQTGLSMIRETRGEIAQFSDNTPGIAPQLQGKARSATQASLVQSAVSTRQRVTAKREESCVLIPMCHRTHMMLKQFRDEEYQIVTQGPDQGDWFSMNISPTDLASDVTFKWRGASEDERTAVKSQQLLAFYNSALQTMSVLPPGELDIVTLFKKIAKEAFQLDDLDKIFKSLRDQKTVDPVIENMALRDEQDVNINPGDDDDEHIKTHYEVVTDKKSSDEAKLQTIRHIERHQVQKKAKADLAKTKARLQALQTMQEQDPNGEGGASGMDGRSSPKPPGIGQGNMAQSMSSPANVMSSVKGAPS